jgi:hypothetical protein
VWTDVDGPRNVTDPFVIIIITTPALPIRARLRRKGRASRESETLSALVVLFSDQLYFIFTVTLFLTQEIDATLAFMSQGANASLQYPLDI